MIVVPLLNRALGLSEKESHATAIAVILPVTILSGFLSFNAFGVDAGVLLPVAVGSTFGGVLGGVFLKKLGNKFISGIFYALMLIAGARLCFF